VESAGEVIIPLPGEALEYLPAALLALMHGEGWIHYHGFAHAPKEDPVEKTKRLVCEQLKEISTDFAIPFGRIVRTSGPNWHQVVFDIRIA
jgi:tRNA G37 N-methylase Trm5